VRIGQPRPHGTRWSEPCLYVRNYQGELSTLLKQYPDLRELRDQLMVKWPRKPRNTLSPRVPYIGQLTDHLSPRASHSPARSDSRPPSRARANPRPVSSDGGSAKASPRPYSPFLRPKPRPDGEPP
jgi:hypothetical protein